jgi:hypothetical protein
MIDPIISNETGLSARNKINQSFRDLSLKADSVNVASNLALKADRSELNLKIDKVNPDRIIPYSLSVVLDFAAINKEQNTINLNGDLTLSGINKFPGRSTVLRLQSINNVDNLLTFDPDWIFLGLPRPTKILAAEKVIMNINIFEGEVYVIYSSTVVSTTIPPDPVDDFNAGTLLSLRIL